MTLYSSTKHSGVKCSVKASEGFLFFLTKSLIFVPKPVIYMKLDDVRAVEFHRVNFFLLKRNLIFE